MESQPAVAVVFHHIGPYHHARLYTAADPRLEHFGEASRSIAACFGPDRFVEGLKRAATMAVQLRQKRYGAIDRVCCDSRRQDTGDEDGPAVSTYSAGKAALCSPCGIA